jgi:hypothetical protein
MTGGPLHVHATVLLARGLVGVRIDRATEHCGVAIELVVRGERELGRKPCPRATPRDRTANPWWSDQAARR